MLVFHISCVEFTPQCLASDNFSFLILLLSPPFIFRSFRRSWRFWCQRCLVWDGTGSRQYSSLAAGCSRTVRLVGQMMLSAVCGTTSTAASGPENRYNTVTCALCPLGYEDNCVITVPVHAVQYLQSAREIHQFKHDVDELKGWIAEKEAVLDSEDQDHDLQSIQTLLRQHEALEVGNTQQDIKAENMTSTLGDRLKPL